MRSELQLRYKIEIRLHVGNGPVATVQEIFGLASIIQKFSHFVYHEFFVVMGKITQHQTRNVFIHILVLVDDLFAILNPRVSKVAYYYLQLWIVNCDFVNIKWMRIPELSFA